MLWEGGYLYSEDIEDIDEQGYLQVADRIKDVIKTRGEWVSSQEIENILSSEEVWLRLYSVVQKCLIQHLEA